MSNEKNIFSEKRHFIRSLIIPFILVLLFLLCFILEKGMDWNFHSAGIAPRQTKNLWGVLTHIFIHADWEHLFNNILAVFVLLSTLYYFYSPIATKVFLLSYLVSGLLLWFIGRESWHIGASGLIYSLAFFLFCSGLLRSHTPLIAISLIIVFLYGGLVWYLLPLKTGNISWEGHLSGASVGLVLAFVFRKQGPQKPIKNWEEEEEMDENKEESEEEKILN